MAWQSKLGELSDTLIKLDEKLGMRKLVQYVCICLIVLGLINFRSILTWGVKTVSEVSEQIHSEQMEKRDRLSTEMVPLLSKMLGSTDADRILYFEYHNSKENLVGIPFKYIDLVLQCADFEVPYAPLNNFRDINVGNLTLLYDDIRRDQIVTCLTVCNNDSTCRSNYMSVEEFKRKYPGNHEFFELNDNSKQQIFINVSGKHSPIGMVVLEWLDEDEIIDVERIAPKAKKDVEHLSAVILSYAIY